MSEPTPTPTPTGGGYGSLPGGGTTSTTSNKNKGGKVKLPTGTAGKRDKTTDVMWNDGSYGQVLSYRSKSSAVNYMTPRVPEYAIVQQSYANWGAALYGSKSIGGFWKKVVEDASNEGVTPWKILADYNAQIPAGTGTTYSGGGSSYRSAGPTFIGTSRADADSIINSAMQATFGRDASKSEKAKFYSQLNVGERKAFKQQTTGKGKGFSADDFKRSFLVQTLRADLKQEPDDQLLGAAGEAQDALENYAASMGLNKSLKAINNDVVRAVSGSNVEDIMKEYRQDAMTLYKPIADRLAQDATGKLTVQDVLSPHVKLMEDLLDMTPGTLKVTDSRVQKLLAGDTLPDYATVNKMVRSTEEFAKTTTAKSEAAELGKSFLRAFGYGA